MRIVKLFILLVFLGIYDKNYSQVNLQTGSAIYSLPVFNWSDNMSRLHLNVALNYNSGNGLKTGEVASSVGQGWNLLAGGVITRMQVGEPDDQMESVANDNTRYPNGYLYNSVSPNTGCPNQLTRYPIYEGRNQIYRECKPVQADRELDYFSFQFNGRTGIFVLDKTTIGTTREGVCLGDSKLKISFNLNISMSCRETNLLGVSVTKGVRTTIESFTIQDENGLKYKFATRCYTKVLKSSFCDPTLKHQLAQPTFSGGRVYYQSGFVDEHIANPYIVSGWYLTEIEDVLTSRKINFDYDDDHHIETPAGVSIAYYQAKNYIMVSHSISNTITPIIHSVIMPDGHSVDFEYGKNRIDMIDGKALTAINVKYGTRFISKFALNSTYLILNRFGTPKSDYQKRVARLYLKSVVQYSADLKAYSQPFTFDYYLGSNDVDDIVPPPFSVVKDIWGFYNGNESKACNGNSLSNTTLKLSDMTFEELKGLCYLRYSPGTTTLITTTVINPKDGYAKNGLLKQIGYPGGGALTYEYEQNYGTLGTQYRTVGGVHVARTKLVDGGSSIDGISSIDRGYSNDCDHPLVTNYSYNAEGSTQSSLWGIEEPITKTTINSFFEPEKRYWTWKGSLYGSCRYTYQYPGIQSSDQAINLTASQEAMLAFAEIMSCVSTILAVLDVVNLALTTSTGPIGACIAVFLDVAFAEYTISKSCFSGPDSQTSITDVFYNIDLNSSNPLPVQFSRAVVKQGDGSNGYTAFTFTNPSNYSLSLMASANPLLSMKQRYMNWLYGLPLKTTVYNASDIVTKESENVYNPELTITDLTRLPSCKCKIIRTSSQRNPGWEHDGNKNPLDYTTNATTNADLKAEMYDMYTGRVELIETRERTFDVNSPTHPYIEQLTQYGYNSINFQVNKIVTTQSNGIKNCTDITYSCDYTTDPTGVLTALNSANMIAIPVKKVSSIIPVGGGKKILSESFTEFTTLSNGDIKPARVLVKRTNSPIDVSTYTSAWEGYEGPGTTLSSDFKEVQKLTYDANGNLVGVVDEGNRCIINKYDYQDKYVVAVVANANYQTDPTAYTSFETSNLGGWTLTGTASYNSTQAVTGDRGLNLNASISLTASLNNSKQYRLSFWATTGSTISIVAVAGSALSPTKSAPTINGFTYYEYEIPISSARSVTITSSGASIIDELRLYPITARMKTVTYDPLIGKTTECDENNRITYYEYDELGRVRFIKDDYRNIVKMNEYNIRKAGCVKGYTNARIAEIYVKECPPSSESYYTMGSNFIYIIPAEKYTSNVSQEEVDQQVQDDLDANGQANANKYGTCSNLYSNERQEQYFTPNICQFGYKASPVLYVVPALTYFSWSLANANKLALDDIEANGQEYANNYAGDNATCEIDYDPIWAAIEPETTRCEPANVYGEYTGHFQIMAHDINPNSSSYNQTPIWKIGTLAPGCTITTNCRNTTITVPDAVATDLYIEYWSCTTNELIQKKWSDLSPTTGAASTYITVCMSGHGATFRYGGISSSVATIPSITFTDNGVCQ